MRTGSNSRRKSKFRILPFFLFLIIAAAVYKLPDAVRTYIYPMRYGSTVSECASQNGVEPYLIWAVMKTESGFDPEAESDVGARGLMQLTEDTYEWVKYRMKDEREITYDQMYDPVYNIEYGSYLLSLLCDEYGDYETALAAYHSGRGNVNKWLEDGSLSSDGKTLDDIPSSATKHYVSKVMRAYEAYNNLYGEYFKKG